MADLVRFCVEAPKYAVEADNKIYSSELGVEMLQHGLCRVQHVLGPRDREYEALIDGAEEGKAAIRVHVADRAAVIIAPYFHH